MISLRSLFGKKTKVFQLLQASAEAARDAALAANRLTQDGASAPAMATFTAARHREKELAAQVSEELINTFVTPLDREDLEAINAALYQIPKTVEKFAQRYVLVAERLAGVDFAPRTAILVTCTDVVADMVREMADGLRIEPMRALQTRLQALEADADKLLLEPYGEMYLRERDPVRVMLAKDLFETVEKAINTCRDVGNVIYSIVLKNS